MDATQRTVTRQTTSELEQARPGSLEPSSSLAATYTRSICYQIRKVLFRSGFNVLFLLSPAGVAFYYTKTDSVAVFTINILAVAPSVMTIAYAADDLVLRFGNTVGALISSTFNNAATLITSLLLLRSGLVLVLQSSFVGALLSNLLLLPGLCFGIGCLRYKFQNFNGTTARTMGTLLFLAVLTILTTTAFKIFAPYDDGIVQQSRSAAIILIICYVLFVVFQTQTHRDIFADSIDSGGHRPPKHKDPQAEDVRNAFAIIGVASALVLTAGKPEDMYRHPEPARKTPQLSVITAVATLAIFTTMLTFNTLFATNTIQALSNSISLEFIGLVLVPFLSSDPTAIAIAMKDEQDLVMALTLGKSVQLVLSIIPLCILANWWGLGIIPGSSPSSLAFDGWQVCIMLGSVLVINYILQEGKTHWFVGVLLLAVYLNIAVDAWFYPVIGHLEK